MVELLATPHKEFVVINCPPGSGKTTAFSHDLPAWLTCRDRAIRGLMGHRIYATAEKYVGRLRRSLERRFPVEAKDDERELGLAVDAVGVLATDFGAFRPGHDSHDLWQRGQFVVVQEGGGSIAEKEPTWTAYGQDSGSLGMRFRFIVWDDVTSKKVVRSSYLTEEQFEWWDDEAEARLEPGGLLLVVGQRLGPNDIYAHCRDKLAAELDVGDVSVDEVMDAVEVVGEEVEVPRKYHHVRFQAHDEERCRVLHEGEIGGSRSPHHRLTADPQPAGCLLDPRRLSWRELSGIMRNSPERFATVYQQEDLALSETLVDKVWVSGGTDRNGFEAPGCWDLDRAAGQVPAGLAPPWVSVASLDPSVERMWALQWWIVQWLPGTEGPDGRPNALRYLIDLENKRMQAGDLLDRDRAGRFFGEAEDLQQRSIAAGAPISVWIVERNAAHRYLLANNTWRFWASQHRIRTLPHDTQSNKSDPDYGIQGLVRPVWMHGLVRLPGEWRGDSRTKALRLVNQVTVWGAGATTDDQVLAQWFLEHKLPSLRSVDTSKQKRLWRPQFIREREGMTVR
ncbi:MAG: hypothetical protein ACLFRV_03880 [Acidimicrobiales bacterium]